MKIKVELALAIPLLALATFVLARPTHCGTDLRGFFLPVARHWLVGETQLFDAGSEGWYLPPWALALFVPLSLLPRHWAHAALGIASLVGILLTVHLVSERCNYLGVMLALLSIPALAVIVSGNFDGVLCLALGLGWLAIEKRRPHLLGLALVILSVKPINVFFPILAFLWLARSWPARDKAKAALLPALALIASFVACGLDWPARYWRAFGAVPPGISPQVSLWRALAYAGLPIWPAYVLAAVAVAALAAMLYRRPTREMLALALCAWLAVSTYALSHHYVLAAPALAMLAERRKWWAVGVWLLSFLPVTRLAWGHGGLQPDALYPAVLALALLAATMRQNERLIHVRVCDVSSHERRTR